MGEKAMNVRGRNTMAHKDVKSETVIVRFPKPLRDALFAKSAETGAPISEIVRRAVAAKLTVQKLNEQVNR
jgi:hypothetical protein